MARIVANRIDEVVYAGGVPITIVAGGPVYLCIGERDVSGTVDAASEVLTMARRRRKQLEREAREAALATSTQAPDNPPTAAACPTASSPGPP